MDGETLQRFREGDEAAVKAVYQRFAGPVFAVALSILGDHALAADATQQTFVKAWRASSTYDPERSLAPWVYAIARRTAIDLYRRNARVIPVDEIEAPVVGPDLETVWETFEVRLALDRLPDEEREVMRMSHYEGLTHPEIAERLGIPLGTVKSRSHRAHRRLLEMLRHLEET